MTTLDFDYDVFVSYRWADPDKTWVRDRLVPALKSAGLSVCLDVEDFVPGRDLILEMTRAGTRSRHALCVISDAYVDGERMVHFESLMARRLDPTAQHSRLIPFVLRETAMPEWLRGLIPVDWADQRGREREWRKLLRLLGASREAAIPLDVSDGSQMSTSNAPPIFIHDYNLPRTFVGRAEELARINKLLTNIEQPTPVVVVSAIGGVGKSCLCRRAIEDMAVVRAFSRIVWFSFYEARAEPEEAFFRDVLVEGLGMAAPRDEKLDGSNENKRLRRQLAAALDQERTLLVLDGFETIQHTEDASSAEYGTFHSGFGQIDRLLKHLLNSRKSVSLISTRVGLKHLESASGYASEPLDLLRRDDAAQLLRALGVDGDSDALKRAAETLGGHALSVVAAGKYLARRRLGADDLLTLVGDPAVFKSTPEGERVERIVSWHREELTPDQEYFLTRLSLHGRAVGQRNFPVVVRGFSAGTPVRAIENGIIQPLVDRGLIERLDRDGDETLFAAHPLMKLAFSTWLDPETRRRTCREWAEAAERSPGLFFSVRGATSARELEPLVDAIEQYLAADSWDEAWAVYDNRGVAARLGALGYYELALRLALQLERSADPSSDYQREQSPYLLSRISWLLNRLSRSDEAASYVRKMLHAARHVRLASLADAEAVAAATLAGYGFVGEAEAIRTSNRRAGSIIALAKGEYANAIAGMREVLPGELAHGRTTLAQKLAEALRCLGELAEARKVLDEALSIAESEPFNCCRSAILWKRINVALDGGNVVEAQKQFRQHCALRRALGLDEDSHIQLLVTEGNIAAAHEAEREIEQRTPSEVIEKQIAKARISIAERRFGDATQELDAAERYGRASGFRQNEYDIRILRLQIAN